MAGESWAVVSIGPALSMLNRIRANVRNLEPVLDGPIANSIHEFFAKRFETEGEYGGTRWAPLSPRTMAWREVYHRSQMPILQFARELWSSLTKRSSPLGYRIATPDSLVVGTSVGYAEKHQLGTTDGRVPQREIIPEEIPAEEQKTWARLVVDYLGGEFGAA